MSNARVMTSFGKVSRSRHGEMERYGDLLHVTVDWLDITQNTHDPNACCEDMNYANMLNELAVGEMSASERRKASAEAAREADRQGDDRLAAMLWRNCLAMEPDERDRRHWMNAYAKALFNSGRQARAFAVLRRLARLYPDRPDGSANLALFYQRAGAHDLAAPAWLELIGRFPEHADQRWWLSSAAFSFIDLGNLAQAEQLAERAIAGFPQSAGGYNALSAVHQRRFDWQCALDAIEQALQVCRVDDRPSYIAAKVQCLSETGAIAACEALLQDELILSPGNNRLLRAAADLARLQGPSDAALASSQRFLDASPDAPEAYTGLAAALEASGDTADARDLLSRAVERFPRQASVRQAMAEFLARQREMAEARSAWDEAARLAPLSIYRLWAQCAFLGAQGACAEAEALLAARRASGVVLWRGRYEFAKQARELGTALDWLEQLRTASPAQASLALSEAEIRIWRQDDGDLPRAVEALRPLLVASPNGVRAQALMARARVALGEPAEAAAQVDAIAADDQRRPVCDLRLWREVARGDWAAVGRQWSALAERFFLPALHLPSAELRLAGAKFSPPVQGGILAVSIMRNERPRLEGFLEHHRRLGVSGFVIVDNGSDDGTTEFLAAEPDVRLYVTQESFSGSSFGMRWLNQVIDLHGRGWVLYADADERLVFPGSETRQLAQLTDHLSARNEQVVPAVMLDLFWPEADGDWFDPPVLGSSIYCPFLEASGGVRRRVFGTTVTLTKAPLIDAAAGVRYLGSHHTTPARPSTVTAAMLHHHLNYLLDPLHVQRMAEEVTRSQHSDHAVDRRRMLGMLERLRAADLKGPESLRYTGTAQLLALGLIRTTAGFEAAASR
jgi:tetratricopeptide (TPR) repeat protein